ncbi:protein adenylyltransferase SelO [Nitrincola tapanii]|uniref:Protein nucleotidyltransferase YdiU n=1 Tax=Nitrincola tapanii TaxID=1708751 RepID=A0A5A9W341_9GAMM|nr:YdiU family protein [Nitrincola tapanii]KAA0875166.1 YdiU family protein [Nitrincola tapanii]
MTGKRRLEHLNFDNSYARLPESWFHSIEPQPLKHAHLISFNPRVAEHLDLDACQTQPQDLAHYFGGEGRLPGTQPLAMKYAGHQFGYYNPDLGDGRGVLLGEVVNQAGQRWDLHLKGSGKTAFSRFGDGRAVLRSSIREYLVSEAMYGLQIPSTSALCLVGSESYTQRLGMEPCAMVLRVTPCHIRFGHFEHFYYQKRIPELQQLLDYCLSRFYPQYQQAEQPYLAFFTEVARRSARLVAQWQSYGFVHGVMNTDNMSILGETFDYGPFTFLDAYDPSHISNKNDDTGRYAFFRQPAVMLWNLACLAQTLLPFIAREALESILEAFNDQQHTYELEIKAQRLGLHDCDAKAAELVTELWAWFKQEAVDVTRFLACLSQVPATELTTSVELMSFATQGKARLQAWLLAYQARLAQQSLPEPQRLAQMQAVNPRYILRNYMAEEAIRAATEGDYRLVNQLLALLRDPYRESSDLAHYAEPPPNWAAAICLTCSS